jgi:hypothetical protein
MCLGEIRCELFPVVSGVPLESGVFWLPVVFLVTGFLVPTIYSPKLR